ncbi:hypothetical protein HN358_00540 [Candidatus Uhrbacteria bacterium]|nr:hypothetical protein [Candidatus Uhrbacteria bacterium]MBT7717116.1 hypothetical protein [Candidatus Uhrbacteria bacterium]
MQRLVFVCLDGPKQQAILFRGDCVDSFFDHQQDVMKNVFGDGAQVLGFWEVPKNLEDADEATPDYMRTHLEALLNLEHDMTMDMVAAIFEAGVQLGLKSSK